MKRCSPLLARAQRLPQGASLLPTTLNGWRKSFATRASPSRLATLAGAAVRRRHAPPSLVSAEASCRRFGSGLRGSPVTREPATKRPVSAEDFALLKQFLLQPAAEGAAATAARAVVSRMMVDHVYADMSGQEAAVMSMVADALQDPAFVVAVYACLRRARVAPSPVALELTAAACGATGDVATAHDVIDQMHEAVEIMHPSIEIYEHAVRACHVAGKWMQAKQLLEAVARERLEASADTHLLVLETCLASGELTATTKLLDDFVRAFPMLEEDELADVLHGLLAMALDRGVLDHALLLRDRLALRKMAIPRETYTSMIELCARRGKWHSARVLLAQLTNARALPVAAPSHEFTRDTQQLLRDMATHGLAISIDVYNAALRAYGGQTTLAKARALVETMEARGVSPDTVSFAAVMCSCGADLEASQLYFDELRRRALPLSLDACHAYVLAASRAQAWPVVLDRYKQARKLVSDDLRKQLRLDTRIQSCVATAHGHLEHDDEMLRVFTDMKVHGLVPNLYVYAEAMKAYVRKGQWRHALMLFDHLWTEPIDRDRLAHFPLTWDAAVDAAIAGDDAERLESIYARVVARQGRVRPHTAAKLIETMAGSMPTDKIWRDFAQVKYLHERRGAADGAQRSWQVVNAVLKRAVSEWDAAMAEQIVREAETALGMRRFNAMTYSLLLELYARKKDHASFLRWAAKMADAGSRVSAYTTRALLLHLRSLADAHDAAAIEELAEAAAHLFSAEHSGTTDLGLTSYADAAELARKVLDVWEVRGHAIHLPSLEEYVALCATATDLEDVFQRLDRQDDAAAVEISPEFVHALFLSVAELAPELQPRLRDFLLDCLETQPRESAHAALGAFCSFSARAETLELFRSFVAESEDHDDLDDEELVIFLASAAVDPADGDSGDSGDAALDVEHLRAICAVIAEYDVSLGAGSITFLLRTMLTLARSPRGNDSVRATQRVVQGLLATALDGSSRDELRAFVEEIATDARDHAHIDEILSFL